LEGCGSLSYPLFIILKEQYRDIIKEGFGDIFGPESEWNFEKI